MCWQLAVSDDRLAESLWQCELNVVQGLVKLSLEFWLLPETWGSGMTLGNVPSHCTEDKQSNASCWGVGTTLLQITDQHCTPLAVCCCNHSFPTWSAIGSCFIYHHIVFANVILCPPPRFVTLLFVRVICVGTVDDESCIFCHTKVCRINVCISYFVAGENWIAYQNEVTALRKWFDRHRINSWCWPHFAPRTHIHTPTLRIWDAMR